MASRPFQFETIWQFPYPLEAIWNHVGMVAHYPNWWPGMKKVEVLHGEEMPVAVGNAFSFIVASPLYKLSYTTTVTDCKLGEYIIARAEGDLVGVGTWKFQQRDGNTTATFLWDVSVTPPLLQAASAIPPVRGVMHFFHDRLMNAGEQGLRHLLTKEEK